MGFEKPTPIQQAVIPVALKGYDILAQAATGTGKTAAFGIPIIEKMDRDQGLGSLILTPTRELALQVKEHLYQLSKYKKLRIWSFYGGRPVYKDIELLTKNTPHIIVGTPGRIKDLTQRGVLAYECVRHFVLDEADCMLDMGFIEDIEWIIRRLPQERQSFFLSATIPTPIRILAEKYLRRGYQFIRVSGEDLRPNIEEKLIKLGSSAMKITELEKIIRNHEHEKAIVFVKTRSDARNVAESLKRKGLKVVPLHGDMNQKQREESLRSFKEGRAMVVVATDVASRGLDIRGVGLVVNYQIPEDPEVYIHRIGRTGRIGSHGKAYSLITPEDNRALGKIKKLKRDYLQL
ncbi:MAG: DEAD/DEAH box helicase [Bacteroidia bacterium]|nr:DEAD/DEAH box helicase [Bacteroidia bacterium]